MAFQKRVRVLALAAFVCTMVVSEPCPAQSLGTRGGVTPLHNKGRFSLVTENDNFAFGLGEGTDRFYTNGIYLHTEWSSPWFDKQSRWTVWGPFSAAKDRAFMGGGITHELHTPETLNPCGSIVGDPLTTSENPANATATECQTYEDDWTDNYARRDRPFAAIASVFVTAQRYFHLDVPNPPVSGPFTQGRNWGRVDLGVYGTDGAAGRQVQKHWHGFFNDTFLDDTDEPSDEPIGWTLADSIRTLPVVQISAGTDLSLYRLTYGHFGVEADGRGQLRIGLPRNTLSVGPTVRFGMLPMHAAEPLTSVGKFQRSAIYLEASADVSAVITDLSYGSMGRYRHFRDEYAVGLVAKPWGVVLSLHLNWQRILYKDPLQAYDSLEPVDQTYHRYGRIGLSFTY